MRLAASCWNRSAAGIWISCGMRDDATTLPSASAAIAFTELVPMSIPTVISSAMFATYADRAERVEHGVVQQPVGRHRTSAVRGPVTGEIGEAPAGLLHDHEQRREIPERHDGLGRDVGRAFGDEDVAPEVAEAAGAPDPLGQRLELVLEPVLAPPLEVAVTEVRVLHGGDPGHRDPARRPRTRRRRAPPTTCARAPARTRHRPGARRPPRARAASPRPAHRGRSSWCRRSDR